MTLLMYINKKNIIHYIRFIFRLNKVINETKMYYVHTFINLLCLSSTYFNIAT